MNHTSSLRYAVAGEKNEKIIYKEESYALQGAIFEVYKKMDKNLNAINTY